MKTLNLFICFSLFLLLSCSQSLTAESKQGLLFFDKFEYSVGRESPKAGEIFAKQGGWSAVKTIQSRGCCGGYLYTSDRIPGYKGNFPGKNSKRVLVVESLPATFKGQTDFYLQYGTAESPVDTIPGNVWFQFWLYPNNYDDPDDKKDQMSRFSWKNKFIYPCNGNYPCNSHQWLLNMGSSSLAPFVHELRDGNLYFWNDGSAVGKIDWGGVDPSDPWLNARMGQTELRENISSNRWTLVKVHYDTTKTSGNRFEMWLKPMGGDWVKVAEWIGGVTPQFTWNIPSGRVGGHRVFRMPTTVPGGIGAGDQKLDSWIYMDDFAMATSEKDLPVYP